MEHQQIDDEELKYTVNDHADEPQRVLIGVHQSNCQKKKDHQLHLLHAEEQEEILSVSLTNTVAKPWTVMIISCCTLLALSAMLGSNRHID